MARYGLDKVSSGNAFLLDGPLSASWESAAAAVDWSGDEAPPRRYRVFFEDRADLAWVARSGSGGGCCSPAIAHQTLT
jgi:hypothetical protein